jgi:hypothetical protein
MTVKADEMKKNLIIILLIFLFVIAGDVNAKEK